MLVKRRPRPPRVLLALQARQSLVKPALHRGRRDTQLVRTMIIECCELGLGDRRNGTCRLESGDFCEDGGFDGGVRGENRRSAKLDGFKAGDAGGGDAVDARHYSLVSIVDFSLRLMVRGGFFTSGQIVRRAGADIRDGNVVWDAGVAD